jgi:tRNA(adenine34) deaminase
LFRSDGLLPLVSSRSVPDSGADAGSLDRRPFFFDMTDLLTAYSELAYHRTAVVKACKHRAPPLRRSIARDHFRLAPRLQRLSRGHESRSYEGSAMPKKKRWVREVKTVSTFPPEGLFTKDAHTIARAMATKKVSPKGVGSGIRMIQFFINRAGKGLPEERRRELEEAKRLLQARAHGEKSKARTRRAEE